MTKNTKRLFFYVAVAVFLILSYIIILYAQGYKYSFSDSRFQRTGAISMKVNVGAKIFLDDEIQGDTSFFGSSYSIDRLLPGNYKLTVKKDGYSSWQKKVTVEGGFVADFPEIMILPEDGEEEQKLFEEVNILFKELAPFPILKSELTPLDSLKKTSSPTTLDEG
ncbi:MAG: PEGA domain-containing protein [Candidatus Yanofskybacteria bacterium]|nr:PEGA domain-containing protein [Candidatus Yanofskybacteria bacterium]